MSIGKGTGEYSCLIYVIIIRIMYNKPVRNGAKKIYILQNQSFKENS